MSEKLNKIFMLTYDGTFVKIQLSDGRMIECKADCFCEADEEEGEDIPALLVVTPHGEYEILTEDAIIKII